MYYYRALETRPSLLTVLDLLLIIDGCSTGVRLREGCRDTEFELACSGYSTVYTRGLDKYLPSLALRLFEMLRDSLSV